MSSYQIFIELLKTLPNIIVLYILTVLFSVPLGILGALAYTGKNKIIQVLVSIYTWVFRGTPLMLQLFIIYYGLPFVPIAGYKITLEPYVAATITFVINYTALFEVDLRVLIKVSMKPQKCWDIVIGKKHFILFCHKQLDVCCRL